MAVTRTHFSFRIDLWTNDCESLVEHLAGVEDYQVALATYRAAVERWPGTPITLRQGARVIENSRRTRTAWFESHFARWWHSFDFLGVRSRPKEKKPPTWRPPLVHGQRELLRAWAYSARFHTSSAFPPDEARATPKVKSSPASLIIDHF